MGEDIDGDVILSDGRSEATYEERLCSPDAKYRGRIAGQVSVRCRRGRDRPSCRAGAFDAARERSDARLDEESNWLVADTRRADCGSGGGRERVLAKRAIGGWWMAAGEIVDT